MKELNPGRHTFPQGAIKFYGHHKILYIYTICHRRTDISWHQDMATMIHICLRKTFVLITRQRKLCYKGSFLFQTSRTCVDICACLGYWPCKENRSETTDKRNDPTKGPIQRTKPLYPCNTLRQSFTGSFRGSGLGSYTKKKDSKTIFLDFGQLQTIWMRFLNTYENFPSPFMNHMLWTTKENGY